MLRRTRLKVFWHIQARYDRVYQHCGGQHLQAYLNQFDFRYSNRKALDADQLDHAREAAAKTAIEVAIDRILERAKFWEAAAPHVPSSGRTRRV